MSDHGGVLRIEGWDEHLYWEIDFLGMTATRWIERADRGWSHDQFPIRRQRGAWEIKIHRSARWQPFDEEIARELEAQWRRRATN